MDRIGEAAISAIFVVWWAVSALNQFHSGAWTHRLRGHVPFGLIPLWTFFAPNPARTDTRIVWRAEQAEGGWSGWREIYFGYAPVWRRWIVNPEMTFNKAVNDLVNSLARVRPETSERGILLVSSYLTLLSLVEAEAATDRPEAVQFAVVRTAIGAEARDFSIVFLSEPHAAGGTLAHVQQS